MKFGLSFLPDVSESSPIAPKYFNNAIELSKYADQSGLSTIKMTEHYLHPYGGFCPSPLIFLSAISSVTSQIRLMTGCILPVFHHPIQIAAETALLDKLSNGRLDVGFARAYLPYEFSAFEVDMDNSRARFEETIDIVKKLWVETNVSYNSEFFKFDQLNSLPKPKQLPHPPVWGAAVNSRQSFAWLGERGFNLLVTPSLIDLNELVSKISIYRESFIPSSIGEKPQVAISMPLYIAINQHEAEKEGDYYLSEYMRVWTDATNAWNFVTSSDYQGYTGMAKLLKQNTPIKMRNSNQALIGTPEHIANKINEITKLLKVDQFLWQIDFGGQPLTTMMNTLKLFVNKVLPLITN